MTTLTRGKSCSKIIDQKIGLSEVLTREKGLFPAQEEEALTNTLAKGGGACESG